MLIPNLLAFLEIQHKVGFHDLKIEKRSRFDYWRQWIKINELIPLFIYGSSS